MNEKKPSSIWKPLILLVLLLITPMLAIKIAKYSSNSSYPKSATTLTKEEVETIVSDYIKLHPEELLNAVTDTYYEKYIGEEKSTKINNAIATYSKLLFDDKLPQIGKKEENNKILMFFSDFDLVAPILEKISEYPDSLKTHFYFRQIVTQTKFSAIIARYGNGVYKVEPTKYISYYLEILKIAKTNLNIEKIEEVVTNLNLNLEQVREIADNEDVEKIVLESTDIAMKMKVDQLPAWILENGMILFGIGGFEAVKKLMWKLLLIIIRSSNRKIIPYSFIQMIQ